MLVLYTAGAQAATTDVEAEIEHAVLEANAVMAQSGIQLRVVLAHTALLPGVADEGVTIMQPKLVSGTDPAYKTAHALRETWHADVVALVTSSGGGFAGPMLTPSLDFAPKAFLVAGLQDMGQKFTLTHELGHILGGVHSRTLTLPDLPKYRYAFPKVAATWHTMMASGSTTRIGYFSNPDVLYFDPDVPGDAGTPTGEPITGPAPADNRRTLNNTGPIVSAFRMTPAWFASSGAATPWFEKRAADEMLADVRFADLNGDGETDAFKIKSDGSWLISHGATGPWIALRGVDPLAAPLAKLRFADLTGDGDDDVFYVDGMRWVVSESGTAAWSTLNTDPGIAGIAVEDLAFGEFSDSTTKADVFRADATTGTLFASPNGSASWKVLKGPDATFKYATKELRLGDFDGDGITDVFRSEPSPGKTWYWSQRGSTAWAPLLVGDGAGFSVEDLLFGDFNGDGRTDVLRPDGFGWYLSQNAVAVPVLLRLSCVGRNDMALGDFDGDGTTDVIRAGIRP